MNLPTRDNHGDDSAAEETQGAGARGRPPNMALGPPPAHYSVRAPLVCPRRC